MPGQGVTGLPGFDRGRAASCCPSPVLIAEEVTHVYGGVVALDAVSLSVPGGAVVALVGPNGSGKTTLLNVVAGLARPRDGRVTVAGAAAGSLVARQAVAIIPDDPAGLDELTIDEQIVLQRALRRRGKIEERRAEVLLDVFGLARFRRVPMGELSRGLRRRAAIVAALQLECPLTLIDEATATLDPEAIVALDAALGALRDRGGAVLLATQDLHFAHRVCDEVAILAAGRVVAAGPPASLGPTGDVTALEDAVLHSIGDVDLRARVRDGLAAL
jgi:ABC-type multidrug transport system ATPase subunit